MVKTITQDQLIRFVYGETDVKESGVISQALQNDWKLKEQYEQVLDLHRQLDNARVTPSDTVIDRIKRYSQSTAPMEHSL